MGMAVAMLIGLWIYDELSFNKYFGHYDTIGKVMIHNGEKYTGSSNPMPLAAELASSFRDDLTDVVMSTDPEQHSFSIGENRFLSMGMYMQPQAPEMFTLEMLSGTRKGLDRPNSILLSGTLARKMFGAQEAVGKTVAIDKKADLTVTGVYEDFPDNTEFKNVGFIVPWDLYVSTNDWVRSIEGDWSNNFIEIYVRLRSEDDFKKVSAKIKDLKLAHISKEKAALKPELFIHPMSKWHLHSQFENRVEVTSEGMKFVWFYGIIGAFVLLRACINFMNLSTARSEKSAREVGVRKAIGSLRSQLIFQFFLESFVVVGLAFILCVGLVSVSLSWFNDISGKDISIPWLNPLFWLAGIIFVLITSILAGSYPAVYLSSFRPVAVLKGTFRAGPLAAVARKMLVVVQFTVSIALIIGTFIVYRQVQHAKNRPVGYSREGLLAVHIDAPELAGKSDLLRNELKTTGAVVEVAESGSPVTGLYSMSSGFDWRGKDPAMETSFGTVPVTQEYGKTIGWQFLQGRDFIKGSAIDSEGLIINEAAVRYMGIRQPVGETVRWTNGSSTREFKILGVIKDMVMNSPFTPAYPTVFYLQSNTGLMFIKVNPNMSVREALSKIANVFRKTAPSAGFDYTFVDEEYAQKFAAEERVGRLAGVFALLAVFISCLGIFGMASFVAEQRMKEVGIRKVLGASVFSVWRLLSTNFVILVLISLLIASPISYYFMYNWLQNYQYRTEISWWIFPMAGIGALCITLLTVSFQTVKAALESPIKSLRSE